jgi:hypothetical protein
VADAGLRTRAILVRDYRAAGLSTSTPRREITMVGNISRSSAFRLFIRNLDYRTYALASHCPDQIRVTALMESTFIWVL